MKQKIHGVVLILVVSFLTGCATVERVPLTSTSAESAPRDNLTVYFFDEDPAKARIVREVVITKEHRQRTGKSN